MELGGIQTIISKAFEQAKADQIVPLLNWLDGEISRYRLAGLCKFVERLLESSDAIKTTELFFFLLFR